MTRASSLTRFSDHTVLLIGAGAAAASLMRRLVEAGAHVHWLTQEPDAAEEIRLSPRPARIALALREPNAGDVAAAEAVIAAVGDPIASRVSAQARALGIPVAVLGRADLSTFDLDDTDDHGGDLEPWRRATPLQRAGAWLSAHLSLGMALLESMPPSFGV
jgi:siroheme synthase (precorrin-2 oxidase/ferrochelatase)